MQWSQNTIRRLEQTIIEGGIGSVGGVGLASIPALVGNAEVDMAVTVTTSGGVRTASIPAIVGASTIDLSVTVT